MYQHALRHASVHTARCTGSKTVTAVRTFISSGGGWKKSYATGAGDKIPPGFAGAPWRRRCPSRLLWFASGCLWGTAICVGHADSKELDRTLRMLTKAQQKAVAKLQSNPHAHDVLLHNDPALLHLHDGGRHFFVLGTVHVSAASALKARMLIEAVNPSCVMVELDEGRARQLKLHYATRENFPELLNTVENEPPTFGKAIKRWAWWILTGYEEFPLRYLMRKYNVPYGLEMWTAIKEANSRHIPVVYGDQDIHVTKRRVLLSLFKDFPQIVRRHFEPDERDIDTLIKDMAKGNLTPEVQETMKMFEGFASFKPVSHERDLYLINSMKTKCTGDVVVAIVGIGHLEGIKKYWGSI